MLTVDSIQFNSIQFFIHTIQDIYISVHGRKIETFRFKDENDYEYEI